MALCEKCGTTVSGQTCLSCGTQVVAQPVTPTVEQVLLDEGGIFVSISRIVLGPRTFAMTGITSVGTSHSQPSRVGPVIAILLGVFLVYRAIPSRGDMNPIEALVMLVGLGLVALGAWIFWKRKTGYVVTLHSASGQVESIVRQDQDFIERLAAAVNQAIILRG